MKSGLYSFANSVVDSVRQEIVDKNPGCLCDDMYDHFVYVCLVSGWLSGAFVSSVYRKMNNQIKITAGSVPLYSVHVVR